MTISKEQFEKLDAMLSDLEADMGALSDWEKGFIGDQIKRVAEYRENVFMSPKQLATIKKIYDAVIGDEEEDDPDDESDENQIPF